MYLPLSDKKNSFCDLALGIASSGSQKKALGEKYTQSMGVGRQRIIVVGIFFCFFFLLIGLRLIEVMGLSPNMDGKLKLEESMRIPSMK